MFISFNREGNGLANQGTFPGDGGRGGNCNWDTALSVAGHSSLYLSIAPGSTVALWGVNTSGTTISLRFSNSGGAAGSGSGPGPGGGGGGAATELGAGGAGGAGGSGGSGGISITAGSVLASYVGHGGAGGNSLQAGFPGVGWGAGGGGAGTSTPILSGGQGGPSGVLLIFK